MNSNTSKLALLACLPATILALTSCSSTPEGKSSSLVSYQEGVPGGVAVETFKMTATVTGIDAAKRKVTLISPNGSKTTYKAGPEVANFDQIRIGDQLTVTAADQLVVFLRKDGAPSSDGQTTAIALAPIGAKPGIFMADTVEVTAKVKSVDLKHHKATLQFPDGKSKTFAVRKDVDLTQAKLGDEVVIRTTEALAISVEKP